VASKDSGPTMDLDKAWEQLTLLRGITGGGQFLHEAQVLQLKIWPLIAAPHADTSDFVFDPEKKTIDFHLKIGKGKKAPPNLEDMFDGLDRSVRAMLGDEWLVRVRVQNKVIYRGTRKAVEVPDGRGASSK
jgi:hypothetical protein